MTIHTSGASARATEADALIVGVIQGADGPRPAPGAREVDEALGGTLTELLDRARRDRPHRGSDQDPGGGQLPVPVIVAVGLGQVPDGPDDQARFEPETLRRAAGAAVRALTAARPAGGREPERRGLRRLGQRSVPGEKRHIGLALPTRDASEAVRGRARCAARRLRVPPVPDDGHRHRRGADPADQHQRSDEADRSRDRAQVLADAVTLVRDLVNTGPSDLVPATFAAEAQRVAAAAGLDIEVLDEHALAEGGYGGILGVGQGSVHPPRLVRLAYTHPDATRTLVLVGKGITFDSGGLSLKPPKSMEWMKSDMGGAAAVLGALQAISALSPVGERGRLPVAGGEHAERVRAAAVRRDHHPRRQDRRGAEHRRRGTAGAGRRAWPGPRRTPPT